MVRKRAVEKKLGKSEFFRWRSSEISRLEGFSDAVFAFAMTLLVVSLEVPQTFDDLLVTMRGFIVFAICFTTLVGIWYTHYTYFRRYGLIDRTTVFLNAILLFVILFYVYPLKFLFTLLINQFFGEITTQLSDGTVIPVIRQAQVPELMFIYAIGYIAVFSVFLFLYMHAYRSRESLSLNAVEAHITVEALQRKFIYISVGILSIIIIFTVPAENVGLAGFIYSLIGPAVTVHAVTMAKKRKKLIEKEKN